MRGNSSALNPSERLRIWTDTAPHLFDGDEENSPVLIPPVTAINPNSPAIVVLAGGGYGRRAEHEAHPVAEWLGELGIAAFVLEYRVAPYRHPVPLLDVKRAVRYLRFYSDTFGIDSDRVGVIGFSAGGHLAASLATQFDDGDPSSQDPIDRLSCRPDIAILCYPVITMDGPFAHAGSVENLLGGQSSPSQIANLSLQNMVGSDTCPVFLWHTAEDASVPVENSLEFSFALSKANIPFELHVYPKGRHGLGLANEDPHLHAWTAACEKWLVLQGFVQ